MVKEIFFNHKGRFSREGFVLAFAALTVFTFIVTPLLYKLCNLFLPLILIVIIALVYAIYITYAYFVICIKRLHDLNITSWISVLVLVPFLNVLLFCFLALKSWL